jgi:hypothetical protein
MENSIDKSDTWKKECWKTFVEVNNKKKIHIIGGISPSEIKWLQSFKAEITFSEYRGVYLRAIQNSNFKYYDSDHNYQTDASIQDSEVFVLRHNSYSSFSFHTWMYAFCTINVDDAKEYSFYVDMRDIPKKSFALLPKDQLQVQHKYNNGEIIILVCFTKDFMYKTTFEFFFNYLMQK